MAFASWSLAESGRQLILCFMKQVTPPSPFARQGNAVRTSLTSHQKPWKQLCVVHSLTKSGKLVPLDRAARSLILSFLLTPLSRARLARKHHKAAVAPNQHYSQFLSLPLSSITTLRPFTLFLVEVAEKRERRCCFPACRRRLTVHRLDLEGRMLHSSNAFQPFSMHSC